MFAARSWAITRPPPRRPTPGTGFSPTSEPGGRRSGAGGGGAAAPHCRWDGARAVPAGSPRSVPAVGSRSRAGWCSGHGRVGGDEDTLGAVPRGSASRGRPHRAAGLGLGGGVSVPGGGRSAAGCAATAAIFRRTVPPMENTWNSPRRRGRAGKRRSSVRNPRGRAPSATAVSSSSEAAPGRAGGRRTGFGLRLTPPRRAVGPPLSFSTAAAPGRFRSDGARSSSSSGLTPPFGCPRPR